MIQGEQPFDFPQIQQDFINALWEPALRIALDSEHAHLRCKRRACAQAKACCMKFVPGKPLTCAGLTDNAVEKASLCVLFALDMRTG